MEQNFNRVFKQIQLSSQLCFIPLHTALYHGTICTFRSQNNKSNDVYLLVVARCNWKTRYWTRQTLGTCPQCAVRSEQETLLYSHSRHCINGVWTGFWWRSRGVG